MTLRDFPKHSQRSSLALAFAFAVTYTCLWVKIAGTVLGTVEESLLLGPQLFGIAFRVCGCSSFLATMLYSFRCVGDAPLSPHRKRPNEEY